MADSVSDFLAREYEYLRAREGTDFYLAIEPYVEALNQKGTIRRGLKRLAKELQAATTRYVEEQNELVAEAKRIRSALAERAPEIDNSNIERPDHRSHAFMAWELDSFAGFDHAVEQDARLQIGFPAVPSDSVDPGVVSRLLQILRGRLRAAEHGEEGGSTRLRSATTLAISGGASAA